MSALTDETLRPIRSTPTPDQAERLRKQAEKILGSKLPPVPAEQTKRPA